MEAWIAGIPVTVAVAGVLALFMAWAIGANDVANAMGTSVGSGALTIRGAILVAALLEFGGAFFLGGQVTDTVRKGILDVEQLTGHADLVVYGMLAALASAAIWLIAASRRGWPVSTTHSIVGSIVGFGAVGLGAGAVNWDTVLQIVVSWVTSPAIGGALAFALFHVIRVSVLDAKHPLENARRFGPFFAGAVVLVLALVTFFKGLKNLHLELSPAETVGIALGAAALGGGLARTVFARLPAGQGLSLDAQFASVERIFGVLQVMTACALAFAHGSNDVANAIGPLAAVVHSATTQQVGGEAPVALWMLGIGGAGIVVGLATYGYRVMETVGRRITELTPSRGFAAELAAAVTIVLASGFGIPVSTTHILVGSVLGVGLARGIGALDLRVAGRIMAAWVITLPAGALLAVFFFYFFKGLFGP